MSCLRRSYLILLLRRTRRLIIPIFLCVLMTSCATTAQRQAASIRQNFEVTGQKIRACTQTMVDGAAYQTIAQHAPNVGLVNPTLAQLADGGLPSDEDVQNIIAVHNEAASCREQAIQDFMQFLPGIVPILVQSYNEGDVITVDLIQRKITWGEANKRRMALKGEYMAKIQSFVKEVDRDLAASRQSEIAQRQAAFTALAQWSYQQQLLMQNQSLINAVNRPVITNCQRYGNSINCTSF
jgi:hypothetical protein